MRGRDANLKGLTLSHHAAETSQETASASSGWGCSCIARQTFNTIDLHICLLTKCLTCWIVGVANLLSGRLALVPYLLRFLERSYNSWDPHDWALNDMRDSFKHLQGYMHCHGHMVPLIAAN